jgi:gamma-glutamylputrescine oxidase
MTDDFGYIDTYYSRNIKNDVLRLPLQDNITTDVCIIGGGLAGVAVALGLIERGKKVVLLEKGRIGFGASGRNGGFVLSGYAAEAKSIVNKVGMDHAKNLYALTINSRRLINKRIKEFKIECDNVSGHLLASWYKDTDQLKRKAEFLGNNFDENIEFWPEEKVKEVCVTDRYHSGLFFPEYFHIDPLAYLRSLTDVIENKGGQVFEFTPAIAVDDKSDAKKVHTDKGCVIADHIVYCGSAYFNGINKDLSRSCLPVSTYVTVTEPIEAEILEKTIKAPYAIRDNRWADDYYRVLPDNSLLWGGGCSLNENPKNLEKTLLKNMLKIYPALQGIKPRVTWSGLMGYTVHKMPHIGRLSPGIWYCTNFGGNGVGPTTAGGEIIASAIADEDEKYKLFEPFGFKYTAGCIGPYIAQTTYKSWEIADWIKEKIPYYSSYKKRSKMI